MLEESSDYKVGVIHGKLEILELGQRNINDSLKEFKSGLGIRLEKLEDVAMKIGNITSSHEASLISMEKRISNWESARSKITWFVLAGVGGELLYLIFKVHG